MNAREKTLRDTAGLSMDPLLSTKVGDFVIEERIGSGGMGVVYRATHPLIGKQVAIKVLRSELVSQQQVERLLIEARSVNAIRHPGIIDIFGFGDLPDGRPYIIMELLQGQSLSALIRQQGRLDVDTAIWILDQMLAALGAAHRAGVVHRDLKPGNVFMAEGVDGTRSVKLVDFGIAKLVQSHDGPTTLEGAILGTPEFMAPEQIRGEGVSPSTDLYAVGVIAFQMLTGARPFNGEHFQVMFAHIEQTPPLPSSRAPGIPPEFDTLVLQLLAKKPGLRPDSAEAVRQALRRVPTMPAQQPGARKPAARLPGDLEEKTRTTSVAEMALLQPAASRWPRRAAGAALLAGVAGGAFLLWPTRPDNSPSVAGPMQAAIAEVPQVRPLVSPEFQREDASPGTEPVQEPVPAAEVQDAVEQAPTPMTVEQQGNERRKGTGVKAKKAPLSTPDKERLQPNQNEQVQPPTEATPTPVAGTAPQQPQVSPPASSTSLPVEEHPAELPRDSQQATVPKPTQGSSQPEIAELQRKLGEEVNETERMLQGRAGAGSRRQKFQELRQSVKNATTLEAHVALHDEVGAWRGLLRDQSELTERMRTLVPSVRASLSDLLGSINDAEKSLRRGKAAKAVDGSPALSRLKELKARAESAFTPEQRDYIRHQLDAWKRNPLGQATGVAP